MAAASPTTRLFHAASSSAGVRGKLSYHFQVKPESGNFGTAEVFTEKIGSSMIGK